MLGIPGECYWDALTASMLARRALVNTDSKMIKILNKTFLKTLWCLVCNL